MSDTPKTDAIVDRRQIWQGMREQEVTDLARDLERNNAQLKAALEKLAWAHYTNPLAWPDNLHKLLS